MPDYLGDLQYEHGHSARLGVLIANLGTPDAPTPAAVRRFLAEFLWDPRVVEAPRWLWWLALNGVILRFRPRRSAHAYQQIWTDGGSPLLLYSKALTAAIRDRLSDLDVATALGMSYGSPSIPTALDELRRAGARRLVVLPLYPQYSGTTTASVFDRVARELQGWRRVPDLQFISDYCLEAGYVEALSDSIAAYQARHADNGAHAHLLFSFHGIPQRYVLAGDPYYGQCMQSARLIAGRLGLRDDRWTVSFQSQVGREEWLRPYTDEWLVRFAKQGGKRVAVVCPGFATDCLETLEEIALRNRATFLANGGERFDYIPALNDDPAHADFLATLIRRHAAGRAQSADLANDSAAVREPSLHGGAAR
jgi:protoporphyrin/coproporphyrin ferrochelatase